VEVEVEVFLVAGVQEVAGVALAEPLELLLLGLDDRFQDLQRKRLMTCSLQLRTSFLLANKNGNESSRDMSGNIRRIKETRLHCDENFNSSTIQLHQLGTRTFPQLFLELRQFEAT
jgi:hypothetical protein